MKVGDLVRCTFQPGSSRIENGCAVQMEHYIKDELGIIVKQYKHFNVVLFPKYSYEHDLSDRALEVLT